MSSSRAQCPGPDDWPPLGTGILWNGLFVKTYSISGCNCEVGWCSRTLADGTVQVIIEYVTQDGTSPCNAFPPDQLIKYAAQDVMADPDVICAFPAVPKCSEGTTTSFDLILTNCWNMVGLGFPQPNGHYDHYRFRPCTQTQACYKQCKVCCDNTTIPPTVQWSDCHYNIFMGYGAIPCAEAPQDLFSWLPGICYSIGHCGGW